MNIIAKQNQIYRKKHNIPLLASFWHICPDSLEFVCSEIRNDIVSI
jgi:hypothetical protein